MYSKEIETLLSEGSQSYAAKEYDAASEKYAEACELYNVENGTDDADLLLLYGKALYQGAVSKSEVFGGQPQAENNQGVAEGKAPGEGEGEGDEDDENFQFLDVAEEVGDDEKLPAAAEDDDEGDVPLAEEEEDDSQDEDNDDGNGDQQQKEEEDQDQEQSDFEVAWEILDLTRSLFESKLAELSTTLKSPYLASDNEESSDEYVNVTKKLSETYDLLGEVSLESENFSQSAIDLENCLALREKLYDCSKSSLISESHYKLSLALEFCVEDPELKGKAIKHLKIAIDLLQGRNDHELDVKKRKDNDELVQDLLVKLEEMEKEEEPEFDEQKLDILKGILGQSTGGEASSSASASAGTAAKINDISSAIKKKKPTAAPAVNDLSSMVKKRKPSPKEGKATKKPKN